MKNIILLKSPIKESTENRLGIQDNGTGIPASF